MDWIIDAFWARGWANSCFCQPGTSLQTKYDWLKSADRNFDMGVLSATNRRTLCLLPGTYTLTNAFNIDVDYVDIVGSANEPAIIILTGTHPISFDGYVTEFHDVILRGFTAKDAEGEQLIYPYDGERLKINTGRSVQQPLLKPTHADSFTYTDWTGTLCTPTQELTLVKAGKESTRLTYQSDGWFSIARAVGPYDLRAHAFFLRYYIDPANADGLAYNAIQIALVDTTYANRLTIVQLPVAPGWNEITICPSMGMYSGTMTDLSHVTSITLQVVTAIAGFYIVFDDFLAIPTGKTKAGAIISCDDGIQSSYLQGIRYMHKHNFPSTWFIAPEIITEPGHTRKTNPVYGNMAQWDEVKAASECGSLIATHSITCSMPKNSLTTLRQWCQRQKSIIADHGYGHTAGIMAIPGGQGLWNGTLTEQQMMDTAKEYFNLIRGTNPYWINAARGATFQGAGGYSMPWCRLDSKWAWGFTTGDVALFSLLLDRCISNKDVFSFYFHDLTAVSGITIANFRLMIDYLKTKVDAGLVDVITFEDILK